MSIMPHLPFASSAASEDDTQEFGLQLPEHGARKRKNSVLGRIQKIGNWFREDDHLPAPAAAPPPPPLPPPNEKSLAEARAEEEEATTQQQQCEEPPTRRPSLLGRRGHKRPVPELPRPLTFRRQNSEKRDRLLPVEPTLTERRAVSADRRPRDISKKRCTSPPLTPHPSVSAPEVGTPARHASFNALQVPPAELDLEGSEWPDQIHHEPPNLSPLDGPSPILEDDARSEVLDERELQAELESKWILNLSMHFRDKSDREKFFVTYAEEPNRWRRVTVSLDYRQAEPDSLEADLKSLHYQRDKSARIYESVRDSLPDIQFFDTVTNLKLQTEDGRLHVHVTEDVNEIISYPSTSLVEHIHCNRYRESELEFDAHLSGFVYRVRVDDQILIKKEIPGPDTVDEFLYEVNALDALQDSRSVISFHGLVIDEDYSLVKGLLISFAPRGSLVDMLYDYKDTDQLPWERRERWAYQIIEGLSEIHEAGFVQGDFTLSNIVIDSDDDAKIIDINRRGCPVGWEPPELLSLIRSGQRISMCIGVKSDLFQLGMVLWALAEKLDEPENVDRIDNRLPPVANEETPLWFRRIVEICLSEKPRDRTSAKQLLLEFPPLPESEVSDSGEMRLSDHSIRSRRSDKQYIDPAAAVHLEDIEEHRRENVSIPPSHLTSEPYTFADPAPSTNYRFQSDGSYIIANRDMRPVAHRRKPSSSATSMSSVNMPGTTRKFASLMHTRPSGGEGWPLPNDWHQSQPRNSTRHEYSDDGASSSSEDAGGRLSPAKKVTRFAQETETAQGVVRELDNDSDAHQLRRQDGAYFSAPLHQDSGFDEQMIAHIESPQSSADVQSCLPDTDNDSRYGRSLHDSTITPEGDAALLGDSKMMRSAGRSSTPQSPVEPLTPASYHTPLTTPPAETGGPSESHSHIAREATAQPAIDRDISATTQFSDKTL